MPVEEFEDKCKYILHFKANSIVAVRIEGNEKSEILEYANQVFGNYCGLVFSDNSGLAVITPPEQDRGNLASVYMTFIPEQINAEANNIVCLCDNKKARDLKLGSDIKALNFQALSIPEVESFFANSVIPFHRINQVDWFSKNLGIKSTLGVK